MWALLKRNYQGGYYWARKLAPKRYQRCCFWGCCYQIFKVLKLFHSQPMVVTLRKQIGDNSIHNRTVSDFQLKS